MAKKKSTSPSTVTVISARASAEVGRIASTNSLQSLSFWSQLTPAKQARLTEEVTQLTGARIAHTSSGLAMGKHLTNIYETCEPYSGAFRKICTSFKFVERTAYRYMQTYNNAKQAFPEAVLQAALARGLNVLSYSPEQPLGKYTDIVKRLPPPRHADENAAHEYVEKLEQAYKAEKREKAASGEKEEKVQVVTDPEALLRQNFRGIKNALSHLSGRQREKWFCKLVGMAMTQAGFQSARSFEPEGVPDDFRQGPGRPRLEAQVA